RQERPISSFFMRRDTTAGAGAFPLSSTSATGSVASRSRGGLPSPPLPTERASASSFLLGGGGWGRGTPGVLRGARVRAGGGVGSGGLRRFARRGGGRGIGRGRRARGGRGRRGRRRRRGRGARRGGREKRDRERRGEDRTFAHRVDDTGAARSSEARVRT